MPHIFGKSAERVCVTSTAADSLVAFLPEVLGGEIGLFDNDFVVKNNLFYVGIPGEFVFVPIQLGILHFRPGNSVEVVQYRQTIGVVNVVTVHHFDCLLDVGRVENGFVLVGKGNSETE